ncbi:MAG TPA: tetratricopeptide repeat protein [Oxalicibacterium sp.]|jgi:CheY-like chemotaxis protein|nr:tetratricopeptide repeat protein [Oxalicibacterium sp.]
MSELAGLTALIIEPHAGMRASIQGMLNGASIARIEFAVSAGTAIRPLKQTEFDLVICEYDLGEGQDGQQLLEDLRHNNIMSAATIFIMVTAERTHEKVMSAAALGLNDYILKPFTADMLIERIVRAVEKRQALTRVRQLMEQGDLAAAIDASLQGEQQYPHYQPEFMRMRAEMHLALGELAEAETVYQDLCATRAATRARLGLAITLFMQERFEEAEALLRALIADQPQFLEAYDWLAKAQQALGRTADAQATLERVVSQSPHALRRLRQLGVVALDAGDVDTAHRAFQQVVSKARFSEFREPEDHVRLVKTAIAKGEAATVPSLIRELTKNLAGAGKTPACRALAAAMLHDHQGESEKAVEELQAAAAACAEPVGISDEIKILLAQGCLANGLEQQAIEVMTVVAGNAHTNGAMAKAMQVFAEAGRDDLAQRVTRESKSQIVDLVSAGAKKARLGDYRGAVDLMSEAAARLPGNPQVVFNAAVAALKCLDKEGWDAALGERANTYIATARRLDPCNPRMPLLANMYRDILKKYAISQSYQQKPMSAGLA